MGIGRVGFRVESTEGEGVGWRGREGGKDWEGGEGR